MNSSRTIAVVGLSSKPERPSYNVASYLKKQSYNIIPINPKEKEILGERCYPDLASVTTSIDVVDIFRRSEKVLPLVEEAAARARGAGLFVVMDRCILKNTKN